MLCILSEGLAWDWINQKLYWTDSSTEKIEVYDPISGSRKVLFYLGSGSELGDIVVDPINRLLHV